MPSEQQQEDKQGPILKSTEYRAPSTEEEWEFLDPQQQEALKEERRFEQITNMADNALERWEHAQPVEVQQAVADTYIENGEIDHAAAGVHEIEAQVVVAALTQHVERKILKPLGLTMDKWAEHIDEADLPAFRRACVKGDWNVIRQHALAAAKMRHELGI